MVVPLGFVAVLTGWAVPAAVAGGLLGAAQRVADWHAAWEPEWRAPAPALALAVGFTAALVALGLLMESGRWWKAAALALVAALLALIVLHPFPAQVEPGKLELTAIDVGQGESLLVAFPDGRLALVDGGGIPVFGARRRPRLDIGEDVVSAYLWSRSIRRLDVVVMTHAHEDHIGGLTAIVKNFRPRELWRGAAPEDDPAWAELKRQALSRGARIVPLAAGSRFHCGGAEVEVLAPTAGAVAARAQNDDSAVLRLRHGRHSFLLTGDITRRVEAQLEAGKIDVLKVAHHGARDSTSAAFLEAADPAVAIVSAGFENAYNLPSPEVLERLRERRVAVLRTDRLGLVTVRSDGRRLELDAAAWGSRPLRLLDPF
jgi:competence protein ComEC